MYIVPLSLIYHHEGMSNVHLFPLISFNQLDENVKIF